MGADAVRPDARGPGRLRGAPPAAGLTAAPVTPRRPPVAGWRREVAYARDIGRAFAGALIFTIPLLMTQEMWVQALNLNQWRILAFFLAGLPMLYGLSYYAGFSRGRGPINDGLDALVALAVGFATASAILIALAVVDWNAAPQEAVGLVAVQSIPGAFGALLARRQLAADGGGEAGEGRASYGGELFLMAAGAVFFALNIAPTEEVIVIAYQATPWHELGVIAVSIGLLHLIVYSAGFAGQEVQGRPVTAFFAYTLPGYAIALMLSLFVLWVFGRVEGHGLSSLMSAVIVLGFPASVGAAAARLLV